MKRGERYRLTVERPAAGGRMIARHEGTIVFVGGAIPGEIVEAEIEKSQRGTVWAATRQVLEPSPDRIAADDGGCGGAVFAHIAYERQRQIKSEIITDAFRRIGRITLDAPADVVASRVDGYRMRARLHRRGGKIGFYREGTHVLCDAALTRQLRDDTIDVLRALEASLAPVPESLIADIEISENIDAAQRAIHLVLHPDAEPEALRQLVQVNGVSGVSYSHGADQHAFELSGSPFVDDVIAGVSLTRHVRSFFQGNRYLTPVLVDHVLRSVTDGPVLDLYAGVGLFSVTAAHAGRGPVTAVEGDRFSSNDLQQNAAGQDVTVTADAVENFLTRSRDRYSTVIVDPPRTGLSKEALAGVIALKSPALVYVSCDVATLARDSRVLIDAGCRIQSVRAFDLFPNTAHVETVIAFAR